MRYVTLVLDIFSMTKVFFVQTPVKVGAKNIFPSFSNFNSGSVQIPVSDSLVVAPGKSFKAIDNDDLYVLYYLGVNSNATIEKALD